MSEVFPGYVQPEVGDNVMLPDGINYGTVRAYLRYNGEGYFVCAVQQNDAPNGTQELDVYMVNSLWKSRAYNQIRYPDLDGARKNM